MVTRNTLLREMFLIAAGLGGLIVVLIAGVLSLGGAFTWVWFARALLVCGLVICMVEVVLVEKAVRVNHVFGPLASLRRQDRTQGCGVALLGALLTGGLLVCGALMEYVVELR